MIFEIQFKGFAELLNKQGIEIRLSNEAKHLLAHKGFNPKYGARQVAGTIRNYLRRPISRLIIGGKLNKGDILEIGINENNDLTFELATK